MRKLLIILALAIGHIAAVAQFPGWGPQSKVVTDSIFSKELNAWRQYNVYLPKSFDVDKSHQYPVLYLLHGMMDTNYGWTMRGHIQDVMDQLVASGDACEMIVVTPNAGGEPGKDWNGYFNMPGWNYENFFFNEFMPTIESKYRVISDTQHRAIAGLSMGGGATVSFAQRHPGTFCCAYAMSALMDLPDFGVPASDPNGTDMVSLLNRSVKEHSCIEFVKNADNATKDQMKSMAWYVDCGDDDFLLSRNIEFLTAMKTGGIPLEFRVRDGGHTWEYWHSALYTALPFVTRNFK